MLWGRKAHTKLWIKLWNKCCQLLKHIECNRWICVSNWHFSKILRICLAYHGWEVKNIKKHLQGSSICCCHLIHTRVWLMIKVTYNTQKITTTDNKDKNTIDTKAFRLIHFKYLFTLFDRMNWIFCKTLYPNVERALISHTEKRRFTEQKWVQISLKRLRTIKGFSQLCPRWPLLNSE